ncbi:MAG: hypothetical protein ACRDQ6_08560, partial [Pseudonocardiaceae bacterium]
MTTAARLAGESAGAFRDMRWPLWVRNALAIRAPRLRELAAVVEGPLAPARAAHAAALASEDAPALESSSAAFDECGAVLLAAEASADAAVVWRRNGLLRGAATLQRAGRSLRGCPNTYPRHRRSCSGCPHPPELE